jgi:hypothetical protein
MSHRTAPFFLIGLVGSAVACSPVDRAETDERTESSLQTSVLYESYDLFDLGNGEAGAFVREPTQISGQPDGTRVLLGLGEPNERSFVLDWGNAPPKTGDVKVDGQGRIYRVERSQTARGDSFINLVRVTPSASNPKTEQLWMRSARGRAGDPPALGVPSLDVADDGTVVLVYPDPTQGFRGGVTIVTCPPEATCSEAPVTTEGPAQSTSAAVVLDGRRALIAVRPSGGTAGDVQIYEAGANGVSRIETVNHASFAQASVYAVRGGGRVLFGLHGTNGLSFVERDNGRFALKAQLPLHADTRPELAIASDGLVVSSRRTLKRPEDRAQRPQPANVDIARVYRESDGFAGADLDLSNSRGAKLLGNGKVFSVAMQSPMGGALYQKLDGAPLRFRDPTRGAGSLEAGRDPCMRSDARVAIGYTKAAGVWTQSPPLPDGWGHVITRIPAGEKLVIGPNSCFYGHFILGDGEVELRGEPDKPIHLIGAVIATTTVRATYTFFDGAHDARIPELRKPFGLTGSLDHVTVTRGKDWYGASFAAVPDDLASGIDVTRAGPRPYAISSSDFGPIDGDLFDFRDSPVDLTVKSASFHDVRGTAIAIGNQGYNQSRLTIADVTMDRVEAAVRVTAVRDDLRNGVALNLRNTDPTRYEAERAIFESPLATPIAMTNLAVKGPTVPAADLVLAGVTLESATGILTHVDVSGARSDGIRVIQSGELAIRSSRATANGRHGIRVEAAPPPNMGPCMNEPTGGGPRVIVITYPRDPVIEDSTIASNAAAGIHVSGPQVPMLVRRNAIEQNGDAGFVIESGRAISKRRGIGSCGPRQYHEEVEVDLPLSPDTVIEDNDIVGNGVNAAPKLDLSSDHRRGILPAANNYWGTSSETTARSLVRCTSRCEIAPVRPSRLH